MESSCCVSLSPRMPQHLPRSGLMPRSARATRFASLRPTRPNSGCTRFLHATPPAVAGSGRLSTSRQERWLVVGRSRTSAGTSGARPPPVGSRLSSGAAGSPPPGHEGLNAVLLGAVPISRPPGSGMIQHMSNDHAPRRSTAGHNSRTVLVDLRSQRVRELAVSADQRAAAHTADERRRAVGLTLMRRR
jgi:hypothetical protein